MNIESKSTRTNAEENVNNKNFSEELIKRKEVKGTPFTIVTVDKKTFGVMGRHRITEVGTYKEIKEDLKQITWDRIMQVIVIAQQEQENINKEIKKQLANEN